MAKQQQQQQAGQPNGQPAAQVIATPLPYRIDPVTTSEQMRDLDIESLARDLFIRRATGVEAHSRTPQGLAALCFAQAVEFFAVRDKRRSEREAKQTGE